MASREKVGGSIIQGVITAIFKPETISTIVAGAAALAAPLVAPALAGLPGGENPYGKVGIWLVLGLAALIFITFVRMMFRLPFIRRLRKKDHPYEGVWLDVYSVKDETAEGFKPVPQRSVFVIYLDTASNQLKLYGKTFENGNINESAFYRGQILRIDQDMRRIEYSYTGGYPDESTPLYGYGWYIFHHDLLDPDRVTTAVGRWVEVVDENAKWVPTGETQAFKIPRRKVKEMIGGKNEYPEPTDLQGFFRLSQIEMEKA